MNDELALRFSILLFAWRLLTAKEKFFSRFDFVSEKKPKKKINKNKIKWSVACAGFWLRAFWPRQRRCHRTRPKKDVNQRLTIFWIKYPRIAWKKIRFLASNTNYSPTWIKLWAEKIRFPWPKVSNHVASKKNLRAFGKFSALRLFFDVIWFQIFFFLPEQNHSTDNWIINL